MKTHLSTSLFICLALTVGCTTTGVDQRRGAMRQQSELQIVRDDVIRMKESVQASRAREEDLYRQLDSVRGGLGREIADLHERVGAQEQELKALASARARDRQEIIEALTGKIHELMGAQASASSGGTQTGREHVVRPGETLSAIAKAYGVSMTRVAKANSMQNLDALRVGQKLFIPD